MKLIIHDSELKESRDLNELYNQLIAELCTGNATGKYTDVSGTRIELDELDAEDAIEGIKIAQTYLAGNEAF